MWILLCTDGSAEAEEAAKLVAQLKADDETRVTLLAVLENEGERPQLTASLERMENALGDPTHVVERQFRRGHAAEQIIAQAEEQVYDLVAVGARGRRGLTRFRMGSTTSRLAKSLPSPLLVVRNVPDRVERVLICTSAELPSLETLRLGGRFAASMASEVGLLHVMSQVVLRPDKPSEDLEDTAEEAMAHHTREGQHLEQATALLREQAVTTPIRPRIRHGLVVDEILAEIEEGAYDLLVIGAHRRPGVTRWLEVLLDDVTDQLLSHAECSVLVVRPAAGRVA